MRVTLQREHSAAGNSTSVGRAPIIELTSLAEAADNAPPALWQGRLVAHPSLYHYAQLTTTEPEWSRGLHARRADLHVEGPAIVPLGMVNWQSVFNTLTSGAPILISKHLY